ncbi:MAG: aminotransferase class I/II-fold pyridoxal phosphate-dependent enzyme, partial [Candidatus Ranarchaeia archaeon]
MKDQHNSKPQRNKRSFHAAERTSTLRYAIRDILQPARELEKQGKKIYYLNIGDPNKFDFRTPQPLVEALISGVESGARGEYGDAQGLPEFRKSICLKEKKVSGVPVSPDDVIVTSGISEGIRFLTTALLDPNDELLAPGPVYPPYIGFTTLAEATPTCYATLEDEKWQPDIDDLRNRVTEKTRAILIINPNNPTGGVLSEKHIRAILDVAGE